MNVYLVLHTYSSDTNRDGDDLSFVTKVERAFPTREAARSLVDELEDEYYGSSSTFEVQEIEIEVA